jgi:glutathione S-transferase
MMREITGYDVPEPPYLRRALPGLDKNGASDRLSPKRPGTDRSPEHLARHPFGRIPVTEDGDFRLYETQALLRCSDAILPGPSLQPRDPQVAARMNQIVGMLEAA